MFLQLVWRRIFLTRMNSRCLHLWWGRVPRHEDVDNETWTCETCAREVEQVREVWLEEDFWWLIDLLMICFWLIGWLMHLWYSKQKHKFDSWMQPFSLHGLVNVTVRVVHLSVDPSGNQRSSAQVKGMMGNNATATEGKTVWSRWQWLSWLSWLSWWY